MPKKFTSKTQKSGEIGEYVAEKYFVTRGFTILERNYTRKWGEIDIVALKDKVLHFIEVKSKETSVLKEALRGDWYRPEDHMHSWKRRRLGRTIETYLLEDTSDREWQLDLAVVYMDLEKREAKVEVLPNIIL